jgi:hypothetical protein
MYYTNMRPVMLWFYCEEPAANDCDGAQIYDALSKESKELLAQKKLKYLRRYKDGEWQLIYQIKDLDEAVKFCTGNGIKVHIEDGRVLATEYVHPCRHPKAAGATTWSFINSALIVYWQEENLARNTSVVRLEDGSKLTKQLIDEVVAAQKRLIIPMVWGRGDFSVLDNTPRLPQTQLHLAWRTILLHPSLQALMCNLGERFGKTVLNEFYRAAFRKKLYRSLDELQAELDAWVRE